MSWLDALRHRVRTLLFESEFEDDLREEMAHHQELDAANGPHSNDGPRRFGNRTYHAEEARRMTWLGSLDVLRQDLRYAWRSLSRSRAFAITVIATLAIGIGLNAALFSYLDRAFVRPPAGVHAAGELRRVWMDLEVGYGRRTWTQGVSYPRFAALRDEAGAATVALQINGGRVYLGRDRTPPGLVSAYVTASYFGVLGLAPAAGRFFRPDEDVMGVETNVAVLSHGLWQRRFHADSSVIGGPIDIGLRRFTVVGVAPPSFIGLEPGAVDIWLPLATMPGRSRRGVPWWQSSTTYGAKAIVRVPPGYPEDAFVTRTTMAARRIEAEIEGRFADSLTRVALGPIQAALGPGNMSRDVVTAARLGAVAVVVLLIAFANVVNLQLARAAARQREIAVRLALGVTRWRLTRLLATESVVLAIVAGAAALAVAAWGGRVVRTLLFPEVVWTESVVDVRVAAFTVVVALAAGLGAGLVPAWQATRPRFAVLSAATAGPSAAQRLLRNWFVGAQVAFSVALVTVGVLLVRSMQNVQAVPLGMEHERLVFAQVSFEAGEAPADSLVARGMRQVGARVAGLPGVEAVAWGVSPPMRGYSAMSHYADGDSTRDFGERYAAVHAVSRDFFRATGLSFRRGTTFSGADDRPPQEVVINESMARLYWPGVDPMGRCLHMSRPDGPCFTVVGIVGQARRMSVIESEAAAYYVPLGAEGASSAFEGTTLIVRTRPETRRALGSEIQSLVKTEFPLGYPYVRQMSENLAVEYRPWRNSAQLFGAFSVLALLVAMLGVYSAVSYSVTQRTREFGVRLALGARVRDILNQVLGEGLLTVGAGVAAGVVLALAAGRLVASLLFGVTPYDVSAMLLAACALMLVAAVASAVPAMRASRVDPVIALRAD